MIRILALAGLLLITGLQAAGQTASGPLDEVAQALRDDATEGDVASISAVLGERTQAFALYSLGAGAYAGLVEENRLDKQVGAGANSGSTSLVSRGSVPSILGVAVEGGALYQSVSENTVTFRLNPAGLARALGKSGYFASGPPLDAAALERALNRISASASFDFSESGEPAVFTGQRSQLKEASLRLELINKRDPRHPSHAAGIRRLSGEIGPLVTTVTEYVTALRAAPGYAEWRAESAQALASVDFDDNNALSAALVEAANAFTREFSGVPDLRRLAEQMVNNIRTYRTIRDQVSNNIAKSSAFAFEYAFNRLTLPDSALAQLPDGEAQPELHTARLIFASPVGSRGEATVNGSVTFFHSATPEMRGNLRDVQISGSLDFRLPEIQGVGNPVLTLAGLGVFLHQQPYGVKVRVRDLETADGAIGVFQSKLTFPAGGSGVKIPLSLTVANRSEFNTEQEVRGAIGMTFDLDRLFAK